ncbi:hypothetical protein THAOC_28221 [Thalassiosira oceanica]|uniref:Uncharacterized protein n=1 Tax=Thalassiosira oceanica TaxID=159749 RepID=K0S0S4_THAOC|nr:hypothetical protein THAOC_28221 [Thalassiosira oceanica]|eukprot:EJK52492.1 hypothetical protein THAOC_28221 [Thalassiosira oceanica]
MAPLGRRKFLHNPQPRTSFKRRLAISEVDVSTTPSRQQGCLISAKPNSNVEQESRPTNRGAAEVLPRSPTQISGQKEVQMVPDGHAALQGLSLIPHLTSVAAGFYRMTLSSTAQDIRQASVPN